MSSWDMGFALSGDPSDEQKVELSGLLQDLGKVSSTSMRMIQLAEKAVFNTNEEKEMMTMNLTMLKQTCEDSEEVMGFKDNRTRDLIKWHLCICGEEIYI